MALIPTQLVLSSAPLPADFSGSPASLYREMVRRLKIMSPTGFSSFVVGDIEPSSNQGPWLKNGREWWVFDSVSGRYVAQDISSSTSKLFTVDSVEPDAPGSEDAQIWLRTTAGRVVGWYFWTGTVWRPDGAVVPSGSTANRTPDPIDFEQYFDTDINVLLHWERGAWRTVSGSPGDVKFVTSTVLSEALDRNPGWQYFAEATEAHRGRVLGVATKDPGATPESSYSTSSGIDPRESGSLAGSQTHVLSSTEIEQHTHLVGALTALSSDNNAYFYRVDNGDNFVAATPRPPNYAIVHGEGSVNGTKSGELPVAGDGVMLVTSKQLSLAGAAAYTSAAQPHNNMQPTLFLWALTKQ